MRQVVLDTETTGLEPSLGHKIIEIGCVELVDRRLTGRHYHQYINPEREVEEGAIEVHGITNEFLADKPLFAQISDEFLAFIKGADLVIHNAPFDVGFINHEFSLLKPPLADVGDVCSVTDTLQMARKKHPGQRNSLDALCQRYGVDNSQRDLHGALLDAEILADVYLLMTGGQFALGLHGDAEGEAVEQGAEVIRRIEGRSPGRVIRANGGELEAHEQRLDAIAKASGDNCIWRS